VRDRILLLVGLLLLSGLATLGPGLITRRGNGLDCPPEKVGCGAASGQNTTFDYRPGDGRVEGNAGDLIALYCQPKDRKIDVYGIQNSAGRYLASFEVDKLRAARPSGLSVDLGQQGVVSMAALDSDQFYVVLKGGGIAAAGLNYYAKVFTCSFEGNVHGG